MARWMNRAGARGAPATTVVSINSGPTSLARNDQTTKAAEYAAPVNASLPHTIVNPGVLMTIGHAHGYPLLPFRPGVSIAEGYTAWRTFTRVSDDDLLALAAAAARRIWSDDPMTNDLFCPASVSEVPS